MATDGTPCADVELEVVLPKWGLTMSEATIVGWLCAEGESVEEGEPLAEVETEKANAEVPSPAAGVVSRLLVPTGTTVPVGTPLAVLTVTGPPSRLTTARGSGESKSPPVTLVPSGGGAGAGPGVQPRTIDTSSARASPSERGRASPVARRVARELEVDLADVTPTGPRGLITEADVRASVAPAESGPDRTAGLPPELAPAEIEVLTGMRKAIAAAMTRSLSDGAQLTLSRVASMEGAIAARATAAPDVTLTDVILAAVGRTLTRHGRLNAHLVSDELRLYDVVNLGLAVALDDGLATPVIGNAQTRTLEEISAERRRLVDLARAGALSVSDLQGGTFTVTNLGGYGVDAFTPILNPPEVGILGIGAIRQQPAVIDGAVGIRDECVLSLTFDHRALDGAPAARFLADVSALLADRSELERALG